MEKMTKRWNLFFFKGTISTKKTRRKRESPFALIGE